MKCMSCDSEINPKWKHAIDSNMCPFCGQNVVDDKLRELFVDLRVLMDELEEYRDQLEDWLLSNYNFIRTTSTSLVNYIPKELLKGNSLPRNKEEGTKYTVKVKTDKGEEEVIAEKIQSEETTNEFFKRAEAVKPNIDGFKSTIEKTRHLKALTNQIKNAGTKVITNDDVEMMSVNMDDADPDVVEEMQSLISSPGISSSLTDSEDLEIPPALLAMSNNKSDTSDLIKLQQMQDRINKSRNNFKTGNVGKGGFTRTS